MHRVIKEAKTYTSYTKYLFTIFQYTQVNAEFQFLHNFKHKKLNRIIKRIDKF